MSVAAARYAVDACKAIPELTRGERAVLLAYAIDADRSAHEARTSTATVGRTVGLHASSVRRALYGLVAHGLVALRADPGRPSIVRFPLAETLSTPRALARGVDAATPRAFPTPTPRASDTHIGEGVEGEARACDVCGETVDEIGRWRHSTCRPVRITGLAR